jgi:hypothetical protein
MSNHLPELRDIDRVCAYLDCAKHLVDRLTWEHRTRFRASRVLSSNFGSRARVVRVQS